MNRVLIVMMLLAGTAGAATYPEVPRLSEPARLDDGSKISIPPMVVPQDAPAADRRPVYIGAGLVVLALVFYWNRRRREKLAGDGPTDGDDDDLHAAARGEDPKDDA